MLEVNALKLMELINLGYSFNEISIELGLSNKEIYKLFIELKNRGIDFKRKYYYEGEICYVSKNSFDDNEGKNSTSIITGHNNRDFKAMIISDLHIGSFFQCSNAWYKIYDYCAKMGIKIIIIAGDFLDGIKIGKYGTKMHDNSLDQIEYATKNYPYDKNILNFLVLGNHDIDSLTNFGIDFSLYLENYRHDIVPIGYGYGKLKVKNERILITHPLCIGVNQNFELSNNYLLIKGHHHFCKSIIGSNGNCSLYAPTLSNLFLNDNVFLPGAMILNATFKDGYFDVINIEHLLINERVNVINSIQYVMGSSKGRKNDNSIKYEEDRKVKVKKL